MEFVDTNIFVRYLTNDDPAKAQACHELLEKAGRNEVTLTTSESVIAEGVFVLSSRRLYNVPRTQIRVVLYPLLMIRGLKLTRRAMYLRALDLFASSNLDFEGALSIAHMERRKMSALISYDQGFDRVMPTGMTRQEP